MPLPIAFYFRDHEFTSDVALSGTAIEKEEYYWIPASCLRTENPRNDPSRIPLFQENQSTHMDQGRLNDCWLIAAFAILANYPQRVKSLFETATEDGKYVIRLYDAIGKPCRITIDEFVPARLTSCGEYEPFFCRPHEEIWPLLLEKAMGKLAGSYGGLRHSHVGHAFRSMFGCIPEIWQNCPEKHHWRKCLPPKDGNLDKVFLANKRMTTREFGVYLSQCSRNQKMMSAGCSGSICDPSLCRQVGLMPSHMYSIVEVRIVEHCQGESDLVMIRLRNPVGQGRWKGDWSDESPLWRRFPSVAKALDFRPVPAEESHLANGKFWMEIRDFSRYFSLLDICDGSFAEENRLRRSAMQWRRSATPKPPPVPGKKQEGERRRSATPRRSSSPRKDLSPLPEDKKHEDERIRFADSKDQLRRSATPVKTPRPSVFKSVVDVLRGRTPPPGFRNRTPPPSGQIR